MILVDLGVMERDVKASVNPASSTEKGRLATKSKVYKDVYVSLIVLSKSSRYRIPLRARPMLSSA